MHGNNKEKRREKRDKKTFAARVGRLLENALSSFFPLTTNLALDARYNNSHLETAVY